MVTQKKANTAAARPAIDVAAVAGWFASVGRDLPWRRPECDGWGVLVSEIMLQQTPVNRVLPIWEQWMDRWPRPSALAAASQGDVVRAWGKLGYPRRALRLHSAAAAIAGEHDDVVPSSVDVLLGLPGIGAYTARAVAAFAYQLRAPVVDTNVRRVISRAVHGEAEAGPPSTNRDLSDVDSLLPTEDAAAAQVSAGLMELGALICTARNPHCAECPIARDCAWIQAGRPAYAGQRKAVQRFAGTDRQVRGKLLDVLRGNAFPVTKAELDLAWSDHAQRDRCLDSLLTDGLVEQTETGLFALPGEHA